MGNSDEKFQTYSLTTTMAAHLQVIGQKGDAVDPSGNNSDMCGWRF